MAGAGNPTSEAMTMRSNITSFWDRGANMVRAHVWNAKGYSTKTFASTHEANGWIASRTA